jgi:hypothetical protein
VEGTSEKREKRQQSLPEHHQQQQQPLGSSTIMAGSQRYMRYIVFAVFVR